MIIHRTILKELFKNFIMVIFSMSVLLFMEQFVRMTRVFMGKAVDLVDIVKLFVYLQPSILMLSVPMAILIAIFLTYGRMATDNEIVVLKGIGMSFTGVSRAAFVLAAACFAVMLFVSVYLLPRGMYSFKRTLHETIAKKASMTFDESAFSDMFRGTVIFVKEKVSDDRFKGVFVYKNSDEPFGSPFVVVAEEGEMTSNPAEGMMKMRMKNGLIHSFEKESSTEIFFAGYDLILMSGIEAIRASKPEEIRTSTLWKGREEKLEWAIELHRRFALSFACLIFGTLGPALSFQIGKIGRLGGFSISLMVLILYYMIVLLGEGLADAGKVSPFWGGWGANMIFSPVTFFFFYLSYRDRPAKRFKI